MKIKKILLPFAAFLAISGCQTYNPNVVNNSSAGQLQSIQYAKIISVRDVTIDGTQSGVGAITGGAVGALAGSGMGGGRGSTIAGVIGGVAAAAVGNAIERASTSELGVEIIVKMESGGVKSIVQAKGKETLIPGQQVILVQDGARFRVIPSN